MSKGINQSYLDVTTQPEEDFYQFVNGGWLKSTTIPDDRSSWGSFHELSKNTDHNVLSILENELAIPGPAKNIAARLFESGMNIQQIETAKIQAIAEIMREINAITNHQQLPALLGKLVKSDVGGIISFSVHPDLGNSQMYSGYVEPGSLGLPEREYYLEDDDKTQTIRSKYKGYIEHILSDGHVSASLNAETILEFEKNLAVHMMSKEDRRDIGKLYNPFTSLALKEKYPNIEWTEFFNAMGIEIPDQIIVTDTAYFDFLNTTLNKAEIEVVKTYLLFLLVHQVAAFSHSTLEQAHFEMYAKTIEGIQVMRPRKERLVKVINGLLGEALGELFVSRFFPPSAKATALEMVDDIIAAYRNRIRQLEWMSDETKTYALEKLAAIRVKIGYPDEWKDYTSLDIRNDEQEGCYLHNILAAATWKKDQDLLRIGRAVDRNEWFMAPQVVNAYYNPMFNEIVFPAAILQPPFFDWEADAAINYGGIGAVIGHEITHGFDDQGSRFDKDGNYNEWWTTEDRTKFQDHTQKLIRQFDEYYPFEDLAINGTFTLGENIADLGGLSVAYDALQLYFSRHGRPDKIDGFTPEQRFFISWATVWRTHIRPEALRNQIKTDPHPPGRYRAVAAPSNMKSFYDAFSIHPESQWYRKNEDRIKIW